MIPVRFADAAYPGELHPPLHEVSTAISTKDELLTAIARSLRLPDYFGANWDALEECLREARGTIVIRDATRLWSSIPRELGTLVEIVLSVAGEGTPLTLIFVW